MHTLGASEDQPRSKADERQYSQPPRRAAEKNKEVPTEGHGASAVFISYRRDDNAGFAGRLYDRLASAFGPARVIMDVDSILPGTNFVWEIDRFLSNSRVLLVVVGSRWLKSGKWFGGRRLDNADDFVRIEIQQALARSIVVIPILVDDTRMPRPQDLPEPIQRFAQMNAYRISHENLGQIFRGC